MSPEPKPLRDMCNLEAAIDAAETRIATFYALLSDNAVNVPREGLLQALSDTLADLSDAEAAFAAVQAWSRAVAPA